MAEAAATKQDHTKMRDRVMPAHMCTGSSSDVIAYQHSRYGGMLGSAGKGSSGLVFRCKGGCGLSVEFAKTEAIPERSGRLGG